MALQQYLESCRELATQWVPEFVEALASDHGECILSDRTVPLTSVDGLCIASALRLPHTIRTLDLENNRLDCRGVQAIVDALHGNPNIVRELRLGKNGLSDAVATVLAPALNHNIGLRIVDLSHNEITSHGANVIFNSATHLSELSLYGNILDVECGQQLHDTIRKNTSLRHLHLGYNRLDDGGAMWIARALPFARAIITLDLSGNNIGNAGGNAVCNALMSPTCTIQRVNLRHNRFSDEVLRNYAQLFRSSTTVTQIFLGHNAPASQSTLLELLSAIRDNRSLTLADFLGWDASGPAVVQHVVQILKKNVHLRTLLIQLDERSGLDVENELRLERQLPAIYIGEDEIVGAGAASSSVARAVAPEPTDEVEFLIDRLATISTVDTALRDAVVAVARALNRRFVDGYAPTNGAQYDAEAPDPARTAYAEGARSLQQPRDSERSSMNRVQSEERRPVPQPEKSREGSQHAGERQHIDRRPSAHGSEQQAAADAHDRRPATYSTEQPDAATARAREGDPRSDARPTTTQPAPRRDLPDRRQSETQQPAAAERVTPRDAPHHPHEEPSRVVHRTEDAGQRGATTLPINLDTAGFSFTASLSSMQRSVETPRSMPRDRSIRSGDDSTAALPVPSGVEHRSRSPQHSSAKSGEPGSPKPPILFPQRAEVSRNVPQLAPAKPDAPTRAGGLRNAQVAASPIRR
jgi:Ran GTPase-activating protein (RanGAP) involved in mRNA processing and transport